MMEDGGTGGEWRAEGWGDFLKRFRTPILLLSIANATAIANALALAFATAIAAAIASAIDTAYAMGKPYHIVISFARELVEQ